MVAQQSHGGGAHGGGRAWVRHPRRALPQEGQRGVRVLFWARGRGEFTVKVGEVEI